MNVKIGSIVVVAFALAGASNALAGEIVVRREARVASAVVTLGDVAELATADQAAADELRTIELGLAPRPGSKRVITAREIEDALALAGAHLPRHRLSGASEVVVVSPASTVELPESPPAPNTGRADRVERALGDALLEFLRETTGQRHGWQVRAQPDAALASTLAAADRLTIAGGQPPFTGRQQFRVSWKSPEGPQEAVFTAEVSQSPAVVVLKRAMNRGSVLGPGDVETAVPSETAVKPTDVVFSDIEQVHGMELTQTLQAGAVLTIHLLQAPIVVKRGQAVTVFARAAGVTVRTTARAKDEGALGALVAVETIDTKQSFFARVRGPQEVEVLAQSTRVAPPAQAAVGPPVEAAAPSPANVARSVAAARPMAPAAIPATRSSWLSPKPGAASSDPSATYAPTTGRLQWRALSRSKESL